MPLAAPASGWRGSSGSVAGEGTGEHVPCVDGGCCCWSQRGWGEVKRKKCGAVGPMSASCSGRESEPLSPGGEGSLCAACGGPGANVRGRVRARILERDGCLASEPARLHVPEASSRRSPDTPPCSPRLRTAERPELPERKGGEKETGASELLEASWQPPKARAALDVCCHRFTAVAPSSATEVPDRQKESRAVCPYKCVVLTSVGKKSSKTAAFLIPRSCIL
ncbi:uncharacterized protein [Patagioenas fasciata]|uniref:uncharacterized protein n=1 Tax=Patagioenas fasciata TaxID=372321 RepID=UPI003A9A020F